MRPICLALSRHCLKYGSWSIAQGIRQGILALRLGSPPKMKGNDRAKEVADWTAGKLNSAMLLLDGESQSNEDFPLMLDHTPVSKTKSTFDLIDRCPFAEDSDVAIKCRSGAFVYKLCVDEDEGLFHVEANSDDVHGILDRELMAFFEREFVRVEELFVIREHDDERHVKDFLEPS